MAPVGGRGATARACRGLHQVDLAACVLPLPRRSLLLRVIVAAALGAVLCQEDELPDFDKLAEEPPLDFSSPGVSSEEGVEQVISGRVVVQGTYSVESMQTIRMVVIQTLMKICENRTNPVIADISQDIDSYGTSRPEFLIEWKMLPPIGGGHYCMQSISEYGYGAQEEPFDPIVGPPPFREALQMEFRSYKPTFTWTVAKWKIFLGNHTCEYFNTLSPVKREVTEWTTTTPPGPALPLPLACDDGDPLMPEWVPPDKKAEPEDIAHCTYATTPCGCAAMRGPCKWVANGGGGMWCQPGYVWERVSCGACPFQADCPATLDDACGAVLLPCACADAGMDCRWDILTQSCVVRQGGEAGTTCEACSAQNFCTKPSALSFNPTPHYMNLATMGAPEVGWLVNISFDRPMFVYPGARRPVQFMCRGAKGEEYEALVVDLLRLRMSNATNLQLNLEGIVNSRSRECTLQLPAGLMRDSDYVFYDGLEAGVLSVVLQDSVKPELLRFLPKNSEVGVTVDTTVAIFFSEPVALSVNASVPLMALGGDWEGGRAGADVVVEELDMAGSRVSFDEKVSSVTFDLSGLLQVGVLYSIVLPKGVLRDIAGNPYEGLHNGIYQFRTTSGTTSENFATEAPSITNIEDLEREWDNIDFWKSQVHVLVGVAVFLGLVVVLAGVLCRMYRARRRFRKVHCELPPHPLDNFVPEALSGKTVFGGKVEPGTTLPGCWSPNSITGRSLDGSPTSDFSMVNSTRSAGARSDGPMLAWSPQSPTRQRLGEGLPDFAVSSQDSLPLEEGRSAIAPYKAPRPEGSPSLLAKPEAEEAPDTTSVAIVNTQSGGGSPASQTSTAAFFRPPTGGQRPQVVLPVASRQHTQSGLRVAAAGGGSPVRPMAQTWSAGSSPWSAGGGTPASRSQRRRGNALW